jgi:excisionase family DNA binding protein
MKNKRPLPSSRTIACRQGGKPAVPSRRTPAEPHRCKLPAQRPEGPETNRSGAEAKPPQPEEYPGLTFPKDRRVLYIHEIAAKLRCTKRHVVDLIDEGRLRAINIGGWMPSGRRKLRVPIEAWNDYLRRNMT